LTRRQVVFLRSKILNEARPDLREIPGHFPAMFRELPGSEVGISPMCFRLARRQPDGQFR
jgi:hypothetical protein